MTDNEVIKALNERTSSGKWIGKGYLDKKDFLLLVNAHNLINRQKAEIEKLEKGSLKEAMTFNSKTIANIRAEAVKEFAERLKGKVHNYYPSIDSYCVSRKVVLIADIENLLEEMRIDNG